MSDTPMTIDDAACERFWRAYLARLPRDHAHHTITPDRFGFVNGPALAEKLAQLVLAGVKCATTSLPAEYASLGEPLPRVGDLSIVVHGDGRPAALIERTSVAWLRFDAVDAEFAATEGEGDGSLAYWRKGHRAYFERVCARLGGTFGGDTEVICQVFRVLARASELA